MLVCGLSHLVVSWFRKSNDNEQVCMILTYILVCGISHLVASCLSNERTVKSISFNTVYEQTVRKTECLDRFRIQSESYMILHGNT
jgi:hypothetical protein